MKSDFNTKVSSTKDLNDTKVFLKNISQHDFDKINSDGVVTKPFEVGYSHVDHNLKLRPYIALDLCQNLAVFHSDLAGFDLEYFRENQKAWIIKGWCATFNKLPKEGEKIFLSTWTCPHKRLQATRSFSALNQEGQEVFQASSRWFLMNSHLRKPMKIAKEFFDAYVPSEIPMVSPDFNYESHSFEGLSLVASSELSVTMRDIDTNHHVNNISYIIWAFDVLPDEAYSNMNILKLETIYIHEATKGEVLTLDVYSETKGNKTDFTVVIYPKNKKEKLCATVKLTFGVV